MSTCLNLVCDPCRKMIDLGAWRTATPLGNYLADPAWCEKIDDFMLEHLAHAQVQQTTKVDDDLNFEKPYAVGLRLIDEHEGYKLEQRTPPYEEVR